jgi:4-hydroxybutyrate CoA-transferase
VTRIAASDLPGLIRPGMTVFVQGSVGAPLSLLAAIEAASPGLGEVHFVSPLTPGLNRIAIGPGSAPSSLISFFDYRDLRQSFRAGPIEVMPLHYSAIPAWLERQRIDVALIQLSPPDADGICSTGLAADFVPDMLGNARVVIAEINRAMPPVANGPKVPLARIDHIVDADYPLPFIAAPGTDETVARIVASAAALVRNGDTIQYGVGRIPQQVVAGLNEHRHLGLHSGLVTPVVRPLIESGAMTGARKSVDTGRHVTGAACGEPDFCRWIAAHSQFAFRPVRYTHAIATLAAIDNLVAINSVIQVDLFGQANAEFAGKRQVSGSGGLVDFMRGARASRGGRAILCLQSADPRAGRSNIVAALSGPATVCRTDVDYVVTEHGVAALADRSVAARAEALIAIAAPEFRDQLRAECAADTSFM